jgi:hypothetical protein
VCVRLLSRNDLIITIFDMGVYSHMRGLRRNCLRLPSEYRDVSRKTHARCAESERERAMRNKSQRSRMVAFERELKMDIAPRVQEA